ncbi:MAG: hypothetical protein N0E48_16025 [Candidatus Thiodiazotropha endolucinida]|nr:hypothetical protein [Candidatus Thiodiazotropha taylori]MCW4344839.1 hypothetical protein [Candidatus Thiodiazotropha endolucinida]
MTDHEKSNVTSNTSKFEVLKGKYNTGKRAEIIIVAITVLVIIIGIVVASIKFSGTDQAATDEVETSDNAETVIEKVKTIIQPAENTTGSAD